MSQTGTIISCGGSPAEYGTNNWVIDFTYQTDVGQTAISRVVVGNNKAPFGAAPPPATSPMWASASSLITVVPNPANTSNPVQLACPDVVRKAAGLQ